MKKLILLLISAFPATTFAFVAADESLVRTSQTVLVQSYEDQAEITVTQTLFNPTDNEIVFDYLLPTDTLVQAPTFYFQAEKQAIALLNRSTAAVRVFNYAQEFNQPSWLGALDTSFSNWWQFEGLRVPMNESVTLKYTYTAPLAFFEDFYTGTIWFADGRETQNLKVNLVRAGSPTFWWANIGKWEQEKTTEAWAQQWQAENIAVEENLSFFASEVETPQLRYHYAGQSYQAEFKPLSQTNLARVVVVLDRSGSVYGVRFERLREALKTLLETMPETTEIKLALVGDTVEWESDEWELNTRDYQRDVFALLDGAQAQGKTDWEGIISALNLVANSSDERYGLVWLGDFSDIPQPMLNRIANAGWRVLMVDFWQSQSNRLAAWWQRYNGGYVPLFNSGFELVEADNLVKAWKQLPQQWPQDKRLTQRSGDWFLPKTLVTLYNHFQIGQIPLEVSQATSADFLPRFWAARKIADYLRQHEGLPLNEMQIQAILSIAHTFGVTVFDLNGNASPQALTSVLTDIETDRLWDEILHLESLTLKTDGIKFWQAKPFYLHDKTWVAYDWDTYQAKPERPILKLWSSAHQNLFTQYSALLAQPMSFGAAVQFCAGQRCASVTEDGRAEIEATDTLLWADMPIDHWANDYWVDLVWAGVLPGEDYEPAAWSEAVSRGQFLVWLQTYLDPEAEMPLFEADVFTDLTETTLGASQALWFKNNDLFRGYSDGTARLEEPLKRIEGLKLLMQAYGLDIRDVIGNFDEKMPSSDLVGWTQPWGYEAYLRGLVKGYEDQTFRPFQPLTQAETFKLLIEAERLLKTSN